MFVNRNTLTYIDIFFYKISIIKVQKMIYMEWKEKYVTSTNNLLKNKSSNDKMTQNTDKKETK